MFDKIRAAGRFGLFGGLTAFFVAKSNFEDWQNGYKERSYKVFQEWARSMIDILGVELEVQGNIPNGRVLVLPNHRSYLDLALVVSQIETSLVGKEEAGKWPIFRDAVRTTSTILVNRNNKDSRKKTRIEIRKLLDEGYSVTVFPEGTTFKGPGTKKFHKGIFEIAVDGQFPIVPLAIEYKDVNDAWVGDDLFVPHFIEQFSKEVTKVKIRFGDPIQADDPMELLALTQTWVNQSLAEMRAELDAE